MPTQRKMARPRKEVDQSTYEGRFAARLKALREKAGLSHEEVAEAVEVDTRTIYYWEAGKTSPQIKYLPFLAEKLGIEVRTLMPKK